jgi:flagellar hook capping protein FlgD
MKRHLVALLSVLGAVILTVPARAELTGADTPGKLMNAAMAQEMKSRAARLGTSTHINDTTWVGYNPAYAGSNYWSVGVGHRWPRGTFGPGKGDIPPVPNDDTGYWDWDHPVHADSLQGWWPMRHKYTSFFIANLPDDQRPWHAIDIGNSISYVINQGPGNRRTFGVTGAWHSDAGRAAKTPDPGQSDVNPNPPRWTPIAGSRSAWCGLRAHGDVVAVDGLTGNPYNEDAIGGEIQQGSPTIPVGAGWTNYHFPGYCDQWDQMLYRDINISGATSGAPVSVTFKYRTRMSTAKNVNPTSRAGWFDKDPLSVAAGNFISATAAGAGQPIDSFMVYVGRPVVDTLGAVWTGSDGNSHQVFDPVRRWFGELIQANVAGGHYELFTTYGDDPPISVPADSNAFNSVTVTRNQTYGSLRAAWGNVIRLVFRVKTNRGHEVPSSDDSGSLPGAYHSGYLGAAELDDVSIDLGSGPVPLGGFENPGEIDNHSNVTALTVWKTSSKPPAVYHHVHDLSDLLYQDLCGPPGAINRICDLAGNVISMGDHDLGEAFDGPFGTAEQEHFQGISSPTVNLAYNPGSPTSRNDMGLDADTAVPTGQWLVAFNIYTGGFDLFNFGSGYQPYARAYPAEQSDGTRTWSTIRFSRFQNFNPDKQCYDQFHDLNEFGQVRTTNANAQPDSIRIGLRKITQCWRFGITTNCGTTLGGYWDNVSLGMLDGVVQSISVLIWELYQDTFPANETPGLPGLAAFDTTAALIKSGLNASPLTGDLTRYDSPEDSLDVDATGDSTEVLLKFRILPGPGNYKIPGDPCSGLRRVPSDTTRISTADGSFWTAYILNPGESKTGFPTTGPCKGGGLLRHDQRWNPLVWCNARMDTADQNLFPIEARSINSPVQVGTYATIYHESDPKFSTLGISRHLCFLVDTLLAANSSNITCTTVPAWVTSTGVPNRKGYDGNANTKEGTKILPDGIFTPGTHVEYFFQKRELGLAGTTAMVPDTNIVWPQNAESSFDAHRWQQFSVLPDAWKFSAYGGLGKACMLYVDWNDRNGTERVWVSVADSIGATAAAKKGAHNGWIAPSKVDINDPSYFVNKNAQPGTTWDMYGIKAIESLNSNTGTIGARLAYRGLGTFLTDKWAKNAPTPEMLEAYYRILMILTGGLNTGALFGPFDDRSQDDTEVIRQFVVGASAGAHRGLFVQGDAAMEDMDINGNTVLAGLLSASLREASYLRFSGNNKACIDLIPTSVITTNGDVYGIRNTCLQTLDVLQPQGDGVAASYYDPVGANPLNAPYVAGVFTDAEPAGNPDNHWQALLDGFDTFNLRSRLCDKTYGRLAYFWNVYTNIFGKICSVAGTGPQTVEVPNNNNGSAFVDFAGIGNNPLRQGSAVINLTLAKADRVTVKIFDVSGRLVRTLADGQMFKAGRVDPALTWDGLDNGGRQVARGAYFVSIKYQNSRFATSPKMIVLK